MPDTEFAQQLPAQTGDAARIPPWRHPVDLNTQSIPRTSIIVFWTSTRRSAVQSRSRYILLVRDGLSIDDNPIHALLTEYDTVTENPNKQGRRRP